MTSAMLGGQTAIVTGAGRGIGRAVALALAEAGAAVILAARSRRDLADVAAEVRDRGGRALAIPTDVASADAVDVLVEQAVAQQGRIDLLVTSAGVASFGPLAGTKPADWDPMLAINLRGAMLCCRAVLPVMLRQQRGTIINLASIAARRPIAGTAVYAATKAGLVAFSRVGVVVPGAVDTPLWDSIPGGPDRSRMLKPDDVARAVMLMAALPPRAALEDLTLLPAGGIL
jgi:NADP-dependent 3-hydroxy acid dehydrogenase YdfG